MTSPARRAAYTVLRRVFEDGAWADRALRGEAERLSLDARDLALATRLAYGAVQRRATLDHVAEALSGAAVGTGLTRRSRPLCGWGISSSSPYLDRAARPRGRRGSRLELAKADSRGGSGLVNAVLRRAAREARRPLESRALPDDTPEAAALKHSHPVWVAERVVGAVLGPEAACALMAAGNEPAERGAARQRAADHGLGLAGQLPVPSRAAPGLPEGLVLRGRPTTPTAQPSFSRRACSCRNRARR